MVLLKYIMNTYSKYDKNILIYEFITEKTPSKKQ